MCKQIKSLIFPYLKYKKHLSKMIFEKSNEDIPEKMYNKLAKKGIRYKKYFDSHNEEKISIEDLAEHLVWEYFSNN